MTLDMLLRSLAVLPNGQLAGTTLEHNVKVLDPAGAQLRTIGERGIEPGEFDSPEGIAADTDGNILVADTGNSRIQRFKAAGGIDVWPCASGPHDVAVSTGGVVYTHFAPYVHRLKEDGTVDYSWGPDGTTGSQFPTDCALAVSGTAVYVLEKAANRLFRFTDNGRDSDNNPQVTRDWVIGTAGRDPGEFDDARDLAVHGDRLYVADFGNQRVQVLGRGDGSFLFQWRIWTETGNHSAEAVAVGGSTIYVIDASHLASFTIR